MNNILQISTSNLQCAKGIINELQIVETWQKFGAKANLVGSVRMGLMMKHLDIDFHIYSERFSIADSFAAIAAFADNSCIKQISFTNLIDTDEKCLEWHLWYHDADSRMVQNPPPGRHCGVDAVKNNNMITFQPKALKLLNQSQLINISSVTVTGYPR